MAKIEKKNITITKNDRSTTFQGFLNSPNYTARNVKIFFRFANLKDFFSTLVPHSILVTPHPASLHFDVVRYTQYSITLAGQTFFNTTDGIPTGTRKTTPVTGQTGVYPQ
jgi:hypothetical protein